MYLGGDEYSEVNEPIKEDDENDIRDSKSVNKSSVPSMSLVLSTKNHLISMQEVDKARLDSGLELDPTS